jgi:Cu2+-exporting ATPase
LAFGELSPASKLERIRKTLGNLLMIGDGVNDSASLAAAGVGTAARGGVEVSLEAAPVFISDANLTRVNELLIAAKRTMRLIRGAFVLSLVYNSMSIILAMSGCISPMIDALIMPVNSLTVLAMTVTQKTFPDDVI